jgi:hypothetical protein
MRVALALGFVGLLIFVQDPGGGIPFLLAAAFFGWNARQRLAAVATSRVRSTIDIAAQARSTVDAALPQIDVSALGGARALLAVFAGILFLAALMLVALALDQRSFWIDAGNAGIAIAALLASAYGGWCVLRFRARLQPQAVWSQLLDGALRFSLCGVGLALAVGTLIFTVRAVSGYVSHQSLAFFSVVLPAVCFAAGAALAFSHRTQLAAWLSARPILRASLFAQAGGAIVGVVLVFGIAAAHAASFKDVFDLISFLTSGAACGLIAHASTSNARGDADFRRTMQSYGGVVLMLLSVQVPILWAGAFAMGEQLIQELSILFLFMPFVFVGTTALSFWTLALGARLYRRSAP